MESFRSNCRESSPRGPLTATSPSSILTSTPGGNVISALPTLDILALSRFKLVLDRRGFPAPLRPWKGPAILSSGSGWAGLFGPAPALERSGYLATRHNREPRRPPA